MNILKIEKDLNRVFSILFALFYNRKKLKFSNKDVLDWKVVIFSRLEMIVQNKKINIWFSEWLLDVKEKQISVLFLHLGPSDT